MGKAYYFRAPNFDINPESPTAPRLGSIFSTLATLTGPLNQDHYVSVPANLLNESSSLDFVDRGTQSFQAAAGLNTGALSGMAGSADVVYAFARDKQYVYQCALLETIEFTPTAEFVADCIVSAQRVQAFLDNSFVGRKRVFMVTGLKIATVFRKTIAKGTSHGPSLQVGVSATGLGVPVEAGPVLEVGVEKSRTLSRGRTLNKIVFAYRVIRIKVKRDGEVKYKYRSGGSYAADEDDDDSSSDEEVEGEWDLEPLDDEDLMKEFPDSVAIEIEPEPLVET